MRTPDASTTPQQHAVLTDIADNGVHIAHEAERGDRPAFSYTVGMWHSFEQPEVLVIGLPDEVARDLLDNVADQADLGSRFAAGTQHDGLVHGYPVRLLRVTEQQQAEWLPLVAWAYERTDVPCVQLVYPDKQGRWPWQADVREGFRRIQPVLERGGEQAT